VSPVPLSVAPSRDTDGGIVGLSEVTHPDDNRIEVADGSQKRRPSIRTSAGGSPIGTGRLLRRWRSERMSRLDRDREGAVDTELGLQIRSDLVYLQEAWNQTEIDDDFLPRDSGILRRLLIDGGGGILRTYRRELGHRGDLKVMAVDLKAQLQGLDRSQVQFATAGGATHKGMTVSWAFICRGGP
jgi:hypothetical protein